jgi:hypothetical protein
MMKLCASMTAAAIVVVAALFITKVRSEHEVTSQMNPLQMMAGQQPLSGQPLVDRSLVFVSDAEDKR